MAAPSRLVFNSPPAAGQGNVFFFTASANGGGRLSFGGGSSGTASVAAVDAAGAVRGTKRRPFFSSPEELILEDEFYDEHLLPEKKRRLTPEQVQQLELSFEAENKLEPEKKAELAKKLGLQPRQVAVWFQNRRARWKNKQLEQDFDRLKSLYDALVADHDSLLSNHDSLLADNHRLRSEVASLTEKLKAIDEVPATTLEIATQVADVQPKAEDQASTGSAVVEEVPLVVDSADACNYTEVVEDGAFLGACGYVVQASEEEDGSVDNGGYYAGLYATGNYTVVEQPLEVELNEMGSGWWVWP